MSAFTRWQQVEEAFHALADEAPGPARAARVRELCDHDAALAAEVEALLAADAGTPEADPHVEATTLTPSASRQRPSR